MNKSERRKIYLEAAEAEQKKNLSGAELLAKKSNNTFNGFRIADCLPVKTRFGGLKTSEQRQMLCNAVLTEVGGAHQTFLRNPLTEIEIVNVV